MHTNLFFSYFMHSYSYLAKENIQDEQVTFTGQFKCKPQVTMYNKGIELKKE